MEPDRIDEYLAAKPLTKLDDDVLAGVRTALVSLTGKTFLNRDEFSKALRLAVKATGNLLGLPVYKVLIASIGEPDEGADVCTDSKGNPEPDTGLRDKELVPFRDTIDAYFEREVKPFVSDAWIDDSKTKVGYEIPFTRLFYRYVAPRPLAEIDAELNMLAKEIVELLQAVEA